MCSCMYIQVERKRRNVANVVSVDTVSFEVKNQFIKVNADGSATGLFTQQLRHLQTYIHTCGDSKQPYRVSKNNYKCTIDQKLTGVVAAQCSG